LTGSAAYDGRGLGEVGFRPGEDQLEALQAAIHADVKEAAVDNSGGTGRKAEFEAELDLGEDPNARASVEALLSGDVGAAADVAARVGRDGRLTFQTFDTTTSETGAGFQIGLGGGVGADADQGSESESLDNALVREPGGDWQVRNCGRTPS
jgi:hypothetical protein